jgi:CrcB protein
LRILLIALFGAVGTLARYELQGVVQIRTAGTFPYGTLLVNLTGCFFLGLIAQCTMNRMVISPDWRGHCRGIFRRLHNFFKLWLGDRENDGGR